MQEVKSWKSATSISCEGSYDPWHSSPTRNSLQSGASLVARGPRKEASHSEMTYAILLIYCLLVVMASIAGGSLPSWFRLTHGRMQIIISFVAGLMLGVGLWHMLPHSVVELGSLDRAVWWTMIGLLLMFFLIRLFHFHQHEFEAEDEHDGHEHHHHHHDHGHNPAEVLRSGGSISWIGIALGLSLHTVIDGIAMAAAVSADAGHGETFLLGFGTFLAVVLHKPLDALSITSLMAVGGWSHRSRTIVNVLFSLVCPMGALGFMLSVGSFSGSEQHVLVGCALAFSAGVFLCISLTDLLPELQFHSRDRLKLSISLLLGVVLAGAIGLVEGEHVHHHNAPVTEHHHHEGDGDDHGHHHD